jgi:hypothetical protein
LLATFDDLVEAQDPAVCAVRLLHTSVPPVSFSTGLPRSPAVGTDQLLLQFRKSHKSMMTCELDCTNEFVISCRNIPELEVLYKGTSNAASKQ